MTPAQSLMANLKWEALPFLNDGDPDLPHATHAAVLKIGETEIRCYQLSNGRRVLDAEDVQAMFREEPDNAHE